MRQTNGKPMRWFITFLKISKMTQTQRNAKKRKEAQRNTIARCIALMRSVFILIIYLCGISCLIGTLLILLLQKKLHKKRVPPSRPHLERLIKSLLSHYSAPNKGNFLFHLFQFLFIYFLYR